MTPAAPSPAGRPSGRIPGRVARRRIGLAAPLAVSTLLLVASPGPTSAQSCTTASAGWSAGPVAGAVEYDVAEGLSGVDWGVEVGQGGDRLATRIGYGRVELSNGRVTPQVVRGSARGPVAEIRGVQLCVAVHGGGSRFASDDDHATTLAGGLGLGLAGRTVLGTTPVVPYLEVRGLGARTSGEVLDLSLEGTGWSVGAEAGAVAGFGRVELRVSGSLDGLAAGLGVTPYAARALRLGAAYIF